MAFKIDWDKNSEHYFITGVDRGVFYPYVAQTAEGATPYVGGVAWNGLTSVSESPEGAEETEIYADNIKYLSLRSAEKFKFTIGCYFYPEEFEECDGSASPVPGVKVTQQSRKTFGFSYRNNIGNDVNGSDHAYEIHLCYGCSASPSSKDHNTINDSPEATELSYEVSTTPVSVGKIGDVDYKPTAHLVIDSRNANKNKLEAFEQVLYGTAGNAETDAKMPLPTEVITMFQSTV